jgi:hypothetical protein
MGFSKCTKIGNEKFVFLENQANSPNSVKFKLSLVFFEYICHIIPIRYFQKSFCDRQIRNPFSTGFRRASGRPSRLNPMIPSWDRAGHDPKNENGQVGKIFSHCKIPENPGECGVDAVYEPQDAKPRRIMSRKFGYKEFDVLMEHEGPE